MVIAHQQRGSRKYLHRIGKYRMKGARRIPSEKNYVARLEERDPYM
jgi:hypothetical protein